MKYFKVNCGDYGYVGRNMAFLNGELLTQREVREYNIPHRVLEELNIPKDKTYTYYGMRREIAQ